MTGEKVQCWYVVYDEQPSKNNPFRILGSRTVIVGKHPVQWAIENPNKEGITWLNFFAPVPLDVALLWPNYSDYRDGDC